MSIKEIVKLVRPLQWVKNFTIFAPLIFSENIFVFSLTFKTGIAFFSFCLLSGAVYIFNDLRDLDEDKRHPVKCRRPLASGKISTLQAKILFGAVSLAAFSLSLLLNSNFLLMGFLYFLLMIIYSLRLKHIVILDVFIIALGFILRVVAGALAIRVYISPWLLICTLLGALFLALGKRRHELILLEGDAGRHRPILAEYSSALLDQMISVVTASTVIAYCLYTIAEETIVKFGTRNLIYTVPFVLYGIFRYLYLIHQKFEGGSPEILLIKDKALLIDIILWITTASLIIYVKG